jgi:HEAT repeat protein
MPPRIVDDEFILELLNQVSESKISELSDAAAFQPLVKLLHSEDVYEDGLGEAIRGRTAQKLSAFGSRAVEPLVSYLLNEGIGDKHYSQIVAQTALMSVAYGSPSKNDKTYSRAMVAIELGKIGDKAALPALIETLQKAQMWYLLSFVAGAIQSLADESVLDSLIEILLHHKEYSNRSFAAVALSKLSHPKTVEALILALKDESGDVAIRAAQALGSLRAEAAIRHLEEATKDERQFSGREGGILVCQAAITALRLIGTPEALEISFNWCIETLKNNPDPELRYSAAYDLAEQKDSRAIPALIAAQTDEGMTGHPLWEPVSKAAQDALEKIGSQETIEALIEHNLQILRNGRAQERINAIFRLKKFSDKRIIPALAEALDDNTLQYPRSTRTVSQFALKALESINTSEALEAIKHWQSKFTSG